MLVTPLRAVLAAALAVGGEKHLAGDIQAPEKLFTPETLQALTSWNKGAFSFLAFNPLGDKAVVAYLDEGTLADDSGTDVMCLFTRRADDPVPSADAPGGLGGVVTFDGDRVPASSIVEHLFSPRKPPPLPGILFFSDFEEDDPVWVPLEDAGDAGAVRRRLRELFFIASTTTGALGSASQARTEFTARFGAALQAKQIPHRAAGRKSLREWLIWTSQVLWEHREDLVTAVKFFV